MLMTGGIALTDSNLEISVSAEILNTGLCDFFVFACEPIIDEAQFSSVVLIEICGHHNIKMRSSLGII